MGIREYAQTQQVMRTPSVRLAYDGQTSAVMTLDAGQDPRKVDLHDAGKRGKRKCAGDGCSLCAVLGPPDTSYVVAVQEWEQGGTMREASLWLRARELGALAAVLPAGGSVLVIAAYLPRMGGEMRDDGRPWLDLVFSVLDASGEGAVVAPQGFPPAPALEGQQA